jgi:hypothetical protein
MIKNKIKSKIQNPHDRNNQQLPLIQQWVPDVELAQPQKVLLAGEPQIVAVDANGMKMWQLVAVWNH